MKKEKTPEILNNTPWSLFLDIDGVLGARLLRPFGQNEFRPIQKRHLIVIGNQLRELQGSYGVRVVINTGRAVGETRKIVSVMNGGDETYDLICEHGTELITKGAEVSLLPEDLKPVAHFLGEELSHHLNSYGHWVLDKNNTCTVQFPANMIGKTDLIAKYKEKILEHSSQLVSFNKYFNREIRLSEGSTYIDFLLKDWGKKQGIEVYFANGGLKKSNAMAIGDELNDTYMMEACGYAACPSDSQPGMKEYLSKLQKGTYLISGRPLTLGTMQAIKSFGEMIRTGSKILQATEDNYESLAVREYNRYIKTVS